MGSGVEVSVASGVGSGVEVGASVGSVVAVTVSVCSGMAVSAGLLSELLQLDRRPESRIRASMSAEIFKYRCFMR